MSKNVATSFPPQIKYIVGNEAAERFSFYGMRSILIVYMTQTLLMEKNQAVWVFHTFMSANWFLTLFGGFLADRYLGKYRTIMILSVVYCFGHLILALFEGTETGLYWGLALIALGAGGIKPCVSTHVGDQFTVSNSHLIQKVFDIFYWSINFGSFSSTLLIPWILPHYGPSWAFGVPGILMALATMVFWMGRNQYVHVPPSREGTSLFAILWFSVRNQKLRQPGESFLSPARKQFSLEKVEGAESALAVFRVFFLILFFWSLYEQHSSTWVIQAMALNCNLFGYQVLPSQIQAANPILILILIPVFSMWIYPAVERFGIKMTPLRKISTGMILTAVSFVMVALIQVPLDNGIQISVAWQLLAFVVLTAAEVMVSITGLEFAYLNSPRSMKSTIMSFWFLMISLGNMLTAGIAKVNPSSGAGEFAFYAGLMFFFSFVFFFVAKQYRGRVYIEGA